MLLLALLAPALPCAAGAADGGFDLKRPEIRRFVKDLVRRDGLDRRALLALLKDARTQPKIIEAMTRPAEKVLPWWEYRERFLTEERIANGAQFYLEHRASLERIAASEGVPAEYLVAICGVETRYGRQTGRYRVLDSLATLAFDYPPRAEFFRSELEQFLLLAREDKLDPRSVTGSYAGAMGAPQFMPSTWRRYAVDADGDGRRDLWNDWDDILASVAHYLREHGWVPGAPVLAETRLDPDPSFSVQTGRLTLNETVERLASQGVKLDVPVPPDTPAVLIPAEQQEGPAYRVGFRNFYVITRYNGSARYAMAVHDLARAIAQRVTAPPPVS